MKQSAPAASDSAADTDETKASHSAVTAPVAWNSGDKCMATWSNDGQYVVFFIAGFCRVDCQY